MAEGDTNLTNLVLEGDLTVGDDVTITDDIDIAGDVQIDGTLTVGASTTTGKDVLFYSETAGDHLLWDASAEALILIGTNAQTALDVQDGNVVIADTLDVNGDLDLDGTGADINVTGAVSIDADLASNINTAAGDITVEAETGSVVIKGDEAVVDAILLDANDNVGTGITMVTGATSGYALTGGPFDVNVTGAISLDADLASNFNALAGDVTVEAETGSVILKGDEAVADAISLDADDAALSGITMATGATSGYALTGGPFDVDVVGGVSIDADLASNINTSAGDITIEAEVASVVIKGDEAVADAILLDANDAVGTGITMVTGTTAGYAITGGPFDVSVTGAISLDGTLASNLSTDAGDITVEAETGSVIIKGDEGVADAISLDANEAAGSGVTIATGTSGGLNVSGGMTTISNGITGVVNVENVMLPTVLAVNIVHSTLAGTVATIADGEIWFVHKVFVRTTADFDTGMNNDATLTVGDGVDPDGFLNLADASLQAAFVEDVGFAAGWAGIENGSAGAYTTDDGGPFVYAPVGAAETIDYAIAGTALAAGAATIYVIYTRIL